MAHSQYVLRYYQMQRCLVLNLSTTIHGRWHICGTLNLDIMDSDNGLLPACGQTINLIRSVVIHDKLDNMSQILWKLNEMQNIYLKRTHLKMSFVKGQPWLLGPNLLTIIIIQWILACYLRIKLIAAINNIRYSYGRQWQHIFDHTDCVQTLSRTMGS